MLRPAVHSKVLAQIGRQVKIRKLLLTPPGRIQHPDPAHLVHPVMADALFIGKGNEVVAPVLPGQLPRADDLFLFLAAVGFSVEELHHFTVVDGLVQGIDAVQQALAVGLGAALHIDGRSAVGDVALPDDQYAGRLRSEEACGADKNGQRDVRKGNPLDRLKEYFDEFEVTKEAEELEFMGGFVGSFGYDFVRYTEKLPDDNRHTSNTPIVNVERYNYKRKHRYRPLSYSSPD